MVNPIRSLAERVKRLKNVPNVEKETLELQLLAQAAMYEQFQSFMTETHRDLINIGIAINKNK